VACAWAACEAVLGAADSAWVAAGVAAVAPYAAPDGLPRWEAQIVPRT